MGVANESFAASGGEIRGAETVFSHRGRPAGVLDLGVTGRQPGPGQEEDVMSSDRRGPSAVRRQAAKEILTVESAQPRPGLLVVTAVGEIDAVSGRLLQRATWQDAAADTVVDLSHVTLLGAAGLRALAQAARRARIEGGRLWLVVPPHPVSVALSRFWPDKHVRGFATLAEALRAVTGEPG